MKWINYFFAIAWAVMFVLFITDKYEPSGVNIGCAFFITMMSFLSNGLEAE